MDYNILYVFKTEKNIENNISDKIIFLVYSILLANAFLNSNIVLYTDMNGMYVFSMLPIDVKIQFNRNIDEMIKTVKEKQKEPYLLLNYNNHLKENLRYNNNIKLRQKGLEINIDDENFENVDVNTIKKRLKTLLNFNYDELLNRINTIL
ncbi:MAG TPA: hypothetical protein PLN85_00175 [archaeon]|nr:hypothetical protein [archaeon]